MMKTKRSDRRVLARTVAVTLALTALGAGLGASAQADPGHFPPPPGGHFPPHGGSSSLAPGNLLVSRSVYENDPSLVHVLVLPRQFGFVGSLEHRLAE